LNAKSLCRELVDPKIAEHRGRIVKTTGDGLLVEFPSVVDAVRCAVEVQRAMVDRNVEIPEDQRITFRIGINLGDVIIDGDVGSIRLASLFLRLRPRRRANASSSLKGTV
jgi:class 3 adenylate cyclase